jgi:hypothetical protein
VIVNQTDTGEYEVVAQDGTNRRLAGPFPSHAAAWRWIDRQSGEPVRDMEPRHFPVFSIIPTDEFISGWKKHLNETGHAETYKNVSTVRPYDMAGVRLLSGELSVPIMKREDQDRVPCPLCSPSRPKFIVGRMAWFPYEQTVQFIGHDCARRHIGEDYAVAEDLYRKETKAREIVDIWPEFLAKVKDVRELANRLLPAAKALQSLREKLDADAPGIAAVLESELGRNGGRLTYQIYSGLKDNRGFGIVQTETIGTASGLSLLQSKFLSHSNTGRSSGD